MENKSHFSRVSNQNKLVGLQNELQRVMFAVLEIEADTPEHLSYAAIDLLKVVTEKLETHVVTSYERDYQ